MFAAPSVRRRLRRYALATAAPRTAHGFRSEWTTVGNVHLHARVSVGPARGKPAVVLVHGLAVSHRYLMPTAALLAPCYDVRVVDLPGFGLSGDPGRVLTITEQADALASWLDANQIRSAILLGNSFGCQVLVDLVTQAPHRCAGLILSGPTFDPRARTAARQILRWLRDLLREDPLQLPFLLRDIRDAGPARVWATFRAALRDPIDEKLPQLTVPTLVLRGAVEPIVPARWAREAADLIPGGDLAVVPGSPHNAVYVAADSLVAQLRPFLHCWAASPATPLRRSAPVGRSVP